MSRLPLAIYKIADHSMEPKLYHGDYIIVNQWHRKFKIGDIVVFKHPEQQIYVVKRVRKIDGTFLHVFGDNAMQSKDSRHFGPIERNVVVGKLVAKI